jgi:regulatory protein
MSTTVARIEHAGPDLRARRVIFSDGSPTRVTSAAAIREIGLEEGTAVVPEALDDALSSVELPLAKERALLLLGYREHSANELERKLRDSGYSADVATAVVKRFVEVQLVDDSRFASAWVRSRRASGYGTRRVRQELERKGIDAETIGAALADEADDADELARALAALGSRKATDRRSRERLIRRLASRGFPLGIAVSAVDMVDSASDDTDMPPDLL